MVNKHSVFVSLKNYVILTRPSGAILVGLATFVGQTIGLKSFPNFSLLIFPFLASICLTAASFVINDYFDIEIDRINKPNKPLPSGSITRRGAVFFGFVLTVMGFSFALLTNFIALLVLSFAYFLSILYSSHLKATGLIGNIAVAFCVSVTFIYGALSINGSINFVTLSFFMLSFFSNLGREVIQSIADSEGDKKKGYRTIALIHGPLFAAIFGSICYAFTLFLGPILFLYIFKNFEISIFLGLIILVPEIGFVFSIFSIIRDLSDFNIIKNLKYINLWMFMVLIATALAINL